MKTCVHAPMCVILCVLVVCVSSCREGNEAGDRNLEVILSSEIIVKALNGVMPQSDLVYIGAAGVNMPTPGTTFVQIESVMPHEGTEWRIGWVSREGERTTYVRIRTQWDSTSGRISISTKWHITVTFDEKGSSGLVVMLDGNTVDLPMELSEGTYVLRVKRQDRLDSEPVENP